MQNILGVIIARGGSKRLPRKNVRVLGGKPLIVWTVEAALNAKTLTNVIVSTDDKEIAELAAEWGADVPFVRPIELATDASSAVDVLRHAVDFMDGCGTRCDAVVLLQATSPFRTEAHIDAAVTLMREQTADTVIAVRMTSDHPYWMWRALAGQLTPFFTHDHMTMARHDLPPAYVETGGLYIVRRAVLDAGSLYGSKVLPYVLSEQEAVDIDDEEDFRLAEDYLAREYP